MARHHKRLQKQLVYSDMLVEFILLLEVWEEILSNTFSLSNYLQNSAVDIALAARMIQSTITSVKALRNDDAFKTKLKRAKEIAMEECVNTSFEVERVRHRKKMPGETSFDEPIADSERKFKTQVYFALFDTLIQEFNIRFFRF
ncbi:Zinc finger MYM-type protein 1 [Holothuria leucospilota]|uniref:Zinc finger MYM-type protein 1 n=1 Tax=Holothuria leucospilota TaxID=206669 RepID=A0A9Q1CNV1_HOLLE|nr:Zinc finger MYM-type protein 1 [Holothuria leucospilota]